MYCKKTILSTTAIHSRKYRISSDLRSQATDGSVSTAVGDNAGILGAVVFMTFSLLPLVTAFPIITRSVALFIQKEYFSQYLKLLIYVYHPFPSFPNFTIYIASHPVRSVHEKPNTPAICIQNDNKYP